MSVLSVRDVHIARGDIKRMKEILHSKLQDCIDKMQSSNDEITTFLQALCLRLGDLINYKHKEKGCYRILVSINDKEYDVYDLIEQVEEHIKYKEIKNE